MGKDRREKPIATYQRHERWFRALFMVFLVIVGLGVVMQIAYFTGRGEKMMDVLARWFFVATQVIAFVSVMILLKFPRLVLYSDALYYGLGQWVRLMDVEAIRRTDTGYEIEIRRESSVHLKGTEAEAFVSAVAKEAGLTIMGDIRS